MQTILAIIDSKAERRFGDPLFSIKAHMVGSEKRFMKNYIIFLVIIAFLTGCTTMVSSDVKEKAPSDTNEIQSQENTVIDEPTTTPIEKDVPAIGEPIEKRYEAVDAFSYKEFENLILERNSKIKDFDLEHCYFKMTNIPKEMKEVYISLWEIGFFAFYENPQTNETIKFHWWADEIPNEYLEELELDKDNRIIKKNNINYYCDFLTVTNEPSDKSIVDEPYRVAIHWVENNKCFYIDVHSDTPLDESVLKYCELEKFTID